MVAFFRVRIGSLTTKFKPMNAACFNYSVYNLGLCLGAQEVGAHRPGDAREAQDLGEAIAAATSRLVVVDPTGAQFRESGWQDSP